jgi:hypothetical protein
MRTESLGAKSFRHNATVAAGISPRFQPLRCVLRLLLAVVVVGVLFVDGLLNVARADVTCTGTPISTNFSTYGWVQAVANINSPSNAYIAPIGGCGATQQSRSTSGQYLHIYADSSRFYVSVSSGSGDLVPSSIMSSPTLSFLGNSAYPPGDGTYTITISHTISGVDYTMTAVISFTSGVSIMQSATVSGGIFGGGTPAVLNLSGTDLFSSGPVGGPFSPASTTYTLSNTGGSTLTWTSVLPSWLTATPPSGTINAGAASTTVTVSLNATANALAPGPYSGPVTFNSNGSNLARSANLTVIDNVPPVIANTPSNITVNTPPGSATATVSWTPPTATDNVGVTSFLLSLSPGGSQPATLASYAFPIGVTTLTYTALDAAGNAATPTSFTVTVIDNVPPIIAQCPANQTIEATGASGAIASWPLPTATDNSGVVTLTRTVGPAPGSTFPVGATPVTYTATDPSANSATCNFTVTIQDTTPPVFAGVPASVTLEANTIGGATYAAYTAVPTATDIVNGVRPVAASHAPGTVFPLTPPGPTATVVTFSASDTATPANTATAQFTVTVRDTTPPVLANIPANQTLQATGPTGAIATFGGATATDIADAAPTITYVPASGSTFPLGATTVTVTARDASNNVATSTFSITVQDTTPPVIASVPANITVEATGPTGRAVTYTLPTATDLVTSPITVLTSHPSGTTFPVGVTTVNFNATDAAGNSSSASFQVTVTDQTAPVFASIPVNVTVEATGPAGAAVTYVMPTATDLVDGVRPVITSVASGSTFPIGTTTVTFTASDLATPTNTSTATFQVTVRDTTPPVIGAVSNITVTAPDLIGAIVTYALPTATDIVAASPTVTATPTSGSVFAIGVHTVTVTAVDDYNNQSSKTFTVTVLSPAQMSVTPATGLVTTGPQGQQGSPFTPASTNYTVTNNGQVPMNFTVTGAPGWVAATPAAGTLAPGAATTVTVALTAAADALPVATHTATLAFNNTTSAIGNTTRAVALTVVAPAALVVTPGTGFVAAGPQGQQGGAFTPAGQTYTLQNSGGLPLSFSASGVPSWVTLSAVGGTLAPGASTTITATLNAGANALAVGLQSGSIVFANTTNALGNTTRPITLNVQEPARLVVTAADGLASIGFQGGAFAPSSKVYTLTNTGAFPLAYTAADNQGWLDTSPASGTIPPGGNVTVTLSVNATANALPSGTHNGVLTLTNTTSGLGSTTRPAVLTIVPNGQVVLKVVTSEGDGTFTFSSPTAALVMSLTTSGGVAQSSPVTLNPATYTVTATPPDGFGLTSVTCSDTDSTGSVSGKSATIVLASSEIVTCTFSSANSRKKTVEVIQRFMSRRADLLLSNGPDANRQVDRLIEAGGGNSGNDAPPSGFTGANKSAGLSGGALGPSRLATNNEPSIGAPLIGSSAAGTSIQGKSSAGYARSFDDRLADLGTSARRESEPQAGLSPLAATGSTEGTSRFAFSTSLSQMMRFDSDVQARKAKDLQVNGAMGVGMGTLPTSRPKSSPFDIWVEGNYVSFADDRNKSDSDGHFGVLYVGADYVLNPRLLVGALVQFDSMQQRSATQAFDIKGKGWMAGPYATLRLTENIFLQGRAAMGQSSNTVSPFLTYTDTFQTRRWLLNSTLVGRWQYGPWQFRPTASVSYIEDVSQAYTDSLGVGIPAVNAALGQFKAGPEFGYRHQLPDGTTFEPRVGMQGIWNFKSSGNAANFGGTLAGPEELRGKVDIGLKTQFTNGIGIDVSGSYDGIGSNSFHATGGKVTVRVPFN